jgi:hypothetical protein
MSRKQKPDNDLVLSSGPAPRRKPAVTVRPKHFVPPAEDPESSTTVEMPSPKAAPVTAAASVTHDEIARLAYSYWEARGRHGGSSAEDWDRAERELNARATGATA